MDSRKVINGPRTVLCEDIKDHRHPHHHHHNRAMLRRCLCVRFSPKCVCASFVVFLFLSILMALVFNINHDFGQSRSPVDFLLHHKKYNPFELNEFGAGSKEKEEDDSTNFRGSILDQSTISLDKGNIYNNRDNKQNSKAKTSSGKTGRNPALGVLNLLKKNDPPSTNKPIDKKILNAHVNVLYQAMIKDTDKEYSLMNFEPKCVGDIQNGEVEDILCVPRPQLLNDTKNPCWYMTITKNDKNKGVSSASSLHCLPYFHILGAAKAGTTDLWNRLMAHPHIISNDGLLHKEALWWGWRRFGVYGYKKGVPQSFSNYVNLFQDTARLIQSSLDNNNHYHKLLITGDASPPDFWDFRGWRNISQNRGLSYPQVLTPHLMRHMYPDPKFILMFKDPIDRLYSDYFFVGGGLTSEDFHRDVVQSVSLLSECVKSRGLQSCFYDNKLYYDMKVRFPYGCYSVFMREWLRVFPLKHFLFIKTEEYEAHPERTLREVIKFLGLQSLKEDKLREIADEERSRITVQKQVAGPMKEKTKALLSRLLDPCSQQLAKMIGQSKFVWETTSQGTR